MVARGKYASAVKTPEKAFVTAVREETTAGTSEPFLQAKNGRASVYFLSLPQLSIVLIYEPTLAREPVLEVRASQTVPVLLAKK